MFGVALVDFGADEAVHETVVVPEDEGADGEEALDGVEGCAEGGPFDLALEGFGEGVVLGLVVEASVPMEV